MATSWIILRNKEEESTGTSLIIPDPSKLWDLFSNILECDVFIGIHYEAINIVRTYTSL